MFVIRISQCHSSDDWNFKDFNVYVFNVNNKQYSVLYPSYFPRCLFFDAWGFSHQNTGRRRIREMFSKT